MIVAAERVGHAGLDPVVSFWRGDPGRESRLHLSLGDALVQAAAQWPDHEALVFVRDGGDELRWTFQELNRLADRLAASLLAFGYRRGDRIAVWGPNDPEWILLEFAIAKAGLVIVTLNPLYKKMELQFALQAAGARGIFHADSVGGVQLGSIIADAAAELPGLIGIHSFSNGIERLLATAPGHYVLEPVDPDSLFMIQYTSGTTGTPKGAQISHSAIVTTALNSHRRWGIERGHRVCHGFPLFHIGGSGCCTPGALLMGATTLPIRIFKAAKVLDLLEREGCETFLGVPTMVVSMMEDPMFARRDLSALKTLIIGGAPVPLEMLRKWEEAFGAQVINCYGQTETCGVTASTRADDPADKKANTSGTPMPGVSVKLLDKHGGIVAHGVPGELCYKGPGCMLGYQNVAPEAASIDADGWLRSGDLATMDGEGFIRIVGRVKEMIIRGGENLSPVEIENFLLQHPDIVEVAVVGVPDPKYGEEACAAIRLAPHSTVTAAAIAQWCHERISRWKVPKYIVPIAQLPLTPSGKVKKYLLRQELVRTLSLDHAGAEHSDESY